MKNLAKNSVTGVATAAVLFLLYQATKYGYDIYKKNSPNEPSTNQQNKTAPTQTNAEYDNIK